MSGSFARSFLPVLAGPLIWALHFVFIYAVHGVLCARPALQGPLYATLYFWVLVAASALALVAMAAIYLRLRAALRTSSTSAFLLWLAGALSLLSALAIVWETIPVLWLPICDYLGTV